MIEKVKEESERLPKSKDSEQTTYLLSGTTAKTVLRGKFISTHAYIKNTRKISNNLTMELKALWKKRADQIPNYLMEINSKDQYGNDQHEAERTTARTGKMNSWFLE